jgi:hypothetical protein
VKKPRANYDIQGALIRYLSDIDPWDFFDPWFRRYDRDSKYEDASEVPPAEMEAFKRWIKDSGIPSTWMRDDPCGSPAYLWLANARRMPKKSWLVHLTNSYIDLDNPGKTLRMLTRGSTVFGLQLTTCKTRKVEADCSRNLTDEISFEEVVWGFASDAGDEWERHLNSWYGRNALIFQCDYGVRTYHVTDEFNQVIFPLCSQYNIVFIPDFDPENIVVNTVDGEELRFEEQGDLLAYMESRHEPGKQVAGLGRLQG